MTEMIERVARALVVSRSANPAVIDQHWSTMVERHYEMCAEHPDYADGRSMITDAFRDARTALAEIREPTEAMKRQGLAALGPDRWIGDAWRAMIDVILADAGPGRTTVANAKSEALADARRREASGRTTG